MLPGAGATQQGIFLGHARGGWWGGVLECLWFVLPACAISFAHHDLRTSRSDAVHARRALGLGPCGVGDVRGRGVAYGLVRGHDDPPDHHDAHGGARRTAVTMIPTAFARSMALTQQLCHEPQSSHART